MAKPKIVSVVVTLDSPAVVGKGGVTQAGSSEQVRLDVNDKAVAPLLDKILGAIDKSKD